MDYTLLRGSFVIRYPDLPRQGPEPDGDTVKFLPDNPSLVESLHRTSGFPPNINRRGISVRLEAIDALETHFNGKNQELQWANKARDELLRRLGFTNVVYYDDLVNKVKSADHDSLRGYVFSNGIDSNGRLIGFVYKDDRGQSGEDGSLVSLDEALVDQSVNTALLADGYVYPAFYGTLPATLREHLSAKSQAARTAEKGLWPAATADPNHDADGVNNLSTLETKVIWPKLFRRIVSFLDAGNKNFDNFQAWLREDPVNRDDSLVNLKTGKKGNLHDVVSSAGDHIRLTVFPEFLVIDPDPAPVVITKTPADVLIVAALPDPVGPDPGHELITLLNVTDKPVDMTDWTLQSGSNVPTPLDRVLPAGGITQVSPNSTLRNNGDRILLLDGSGAKIDQVTYQATQVKQGRTIVVGR
jgi:endonuclease YncB( thermonuclease family)